MAFRPRKDRVPHAGSEEQQLWQTVREYLHTLDKLGQSANQDLVTLDEKRKRFIDEQSEGNAGKDEGSKDALNALYRRVDRGYEEEQREIVRALEKLEVLIAVRDDSNSDAASKRKKRKTDAAGSSSMSPQLQSSLAKERNISPLSVRDEGNGSLSSGSLVVPTPEKEKKRSNSKSNVMTGSAAPSLQRRGTLTKDGHPSSGSASGQSNSSSAMKESFKDLSSASGYVDPARARREVLAHQLPLQKGRKVAFRQPSKNKVGPGAANMSTMTSRSAASANAPGSVQGYTTGQGGLAVPDDEGETWIMATIIECINNDRNRYVVQDAEDTAIMPTYNTTLKAIVPLPESLTTLPLEDYKVGAQVMGLYPDTSCFYRAIVRGGGPGLSGKLTAKMHRRADELLNTAYRLEFEDDGGAIQNVPASLVVERP